MPRKLAVHFECERCPRTWFVDYEEGQELPEAPGFEGTLTTAAGESKEVDFRCLCENCEKAVSNYFDSIMKVQKKSPKRGAKKKAQTEESGPDDIEVTVDG